MYRAVRAEVTAALETVFDAWGVEVDDPGLEQPPEEQDAVIATNVAYRLAGQRGEAPPATAATLVDSLDADELTYVRTIEQAGPYVNFLPAPAYYRDTLQAGDETIGQLPDRDESVVVEHTSANPTGPVHVGRARNPIIGDALANVLEYAGYDVDRHYYVNDAGRQIAVFTWAYETIDEAELPEPERDRSEYDLVRYYRAGTTRLEEGDDETVEAAEAEIEAIMQGLEEGEDAVYERVSRVVDQVLDGMRVCLERLPATFDEFVKETQFIRDGSTTNIARRLQSSDHSVYKDDAWQLDLSDWGIDKNLVFLRSDGTSLYTTRDLAHHEWKFDTYDTAVTVLGEGHDLQATQLEAALEILGNDTDVLDQVLYGWVNLPGGEGMSTREGTGVLLDELLDEAIERARQEVTDRLDDRIRGDELTDADVDRIARQVGIGAVRYDIVSKQPTKAITFEWDRALDFEAQSAPYIQYAHARSCGILTEAKAAGLAVPEEPSVAGLREPATRELIETIAHFPAEVEGAAEERTPHTIATYTRRVADRFNRFYRDCPVLDAPDETQAVRLATVAATKQTLANGLAILGIEAPESM